MGALSGCPSATSTHHWNAWLSFCSIRHELLYQTLTRLSAPAWSREAVMGGTPTFGRNHHLARDESTRFHCVSALPDQAANRWAVGARADAMATVRADTDAVLTWTGEDLWQQLEALLPFLPAQVSSGRALVGFGRVQLALRLLH